MPRKLQLTWDKARRRWKKKYNGKQYYFQFGSSKDDSEGYRRALAAWEAKRAELDGSEPQELPDDWGILKMGFGGFVVPAAPSEPQTGPSVSDAIQRFLKQKERQVDQGKISAGRLDNLRRQLEIAEESFGSSTKVSELTAEAFQGLHDDLSDRKTITRTYAANVQASARQFLQWLYDSELIDKLPRNFRSRDLTINVETRKVKTFSKHEVQALLDKAREASKLHLLLMLNCGFTQIDVSNLKPEEIDWQKGTITRKRSKTQKHEDVPEVTYTLWDETFRLLKAHGHRQGERALLNERGGPLLVRELKQGRTKLHKVDNIGLTYNRLSRALGIQKPLKLFRKTAATTLASGPHKGLESLFLGHSPRTIADKHYTSREVFPVDAISWLGEQFGFPTERHR